ncbi:MAG: Undecaprenyl-phosphate mannosyltransferase [Candidatus Omnitrophica bacterium ADurb.Bin277]|nr:MAG: Undecaprenyl-phosphate mannosyltransferase [Candidatus Omnitrophica bacterium ADurb.Bin277]
MKLSVIIPVHNEKDTVEEIVRRVLAVDLDKEIIVVDDKSNDGTSEIIKNKLARLPGVRVVFMKKNHGKGFAIRAALRRVTGDVVIVQDADLEYDPNDYKKVLAPLERGEATVVYGSRFMHLKTLFYIRQWLGSKLLGRDCRVGHVYFANFLCIKILNLLVLLLYGQKITDEATCYKVFPADTLRKMTLKCTRFEFCPEVTAKACKMGQRIVEVPITYKPRKTEHGKKINWKDGVAAMVTLFRFRFTD